MIFLRKAVIQYIFSPPSSPLQQKTAAKATVVLIIQKHPSFLLKTQPLCHLFFIPLQANGLFSQPCGCAEAVFTGESPYYQRQKKKI